MEYDPAVLRHFGADPWLIGRVLAGLASTRPHDAEAFPIGIEEEYFLADARTGEAAFLAPDSFFENAAAATEGRVGREFLQSQVEAATPPYACLRSARAELSYIRRMLGTLAAERGLAVLACGTHPTARWREAARSERDRYGRIMDDLQMIGQRNMLCGMHVHVQLPDPDRRVDVMCRMIPYLPLFLALSTSSPFWQARPTGLKGYRLAAYDELPRTGIPELFRNTGAYDAYVAALVRSGVTPDSSHVWWMIRPSAKYPTLELRAPDCCTRLDDAIALTALFRALARHLYRNPDHNRGLTAVERAIARENKWRAQRYGVHGTFATADGAIAVADILEPVLAMVAEDAESLGCAQELAGCRTIVREGTSADAQLALFADEEARNGSAAALTAVARWIGRTTVGDWGGGTRQPDAAEPSPAAKDLNRGG
ncbi:carboxylate-amine ligase [Methylobacterium gregans]|uniref:Putative glutamate--cysteine ligase 2 n=1 Tax=Methylobacterium gregans TaxID=374424 RepID=A0AA37HUG7_9HYPH|nr:carboxylate-amine ligase [Methylobacterium gregans]MDQ0524122.1 carboxylate-amine ligase [Methylobacterium gregans]GJD82133.1 Glutamate--cysteine ligase [Methylobacterium gregans]GLS57279.1 putative glutamate--cysteine ligase 2 [Methylobacterium gregans]